MSSVNKSRPCKAIMLSILRKKNPYEQPAKAVYAQLLEKTRTPVFYMNYGVPDTFDGRFDLLVLHAFFVISRLTGEGQEGRDFNQALFDTIFADMDQSLREIGIGDMGIPKRMRKMMKAFNGRMHAYADGLVDEAKLSDVLKRNVYGTIKDVPAQHIESMRDYMKRSIGTLEKYSSLDVMAGKVVF
jgi:cytochrome b pre-mRNA-processing protein 3